ncbi:hypothetical protein HMPREF3039_02588 [Akkermansia sp. KLE1798]|nr:hypothetical protein HMPREF3039_02588 [Akkermansia sp. KLE1798]
MATPFESLFREEMSVFNCCIVAIRTDCGDCTSLWMEASESGQIRKAMSMMILVRVANPL